MSIPALERARNELASLRATLVDHPLYASVRTLDDVRTFQEHHVYAVWDFMSLLKALQRSLTCVEIPWRPTGDAVTRRLINEIVVGEESDDDARGGYVSHFELYLRSMRETGASTTAIEETIERVRRGSALDHALAPAPAAARRFVESTFTVIRSGSLPAIAAAFTWGREDVIPAMFRRLVADLQGRGANVTTFVDYLERHVVLDGDRHGPMAERMLVAICGEDESAWQAASAAAATTLRARIELWNDVHAEMQVSPSLHRVASAQPY